MQFLTAVSPQSFSTPGWKVETKYSTRVLTGNWVEERRKVRKGREWTEGLGDGLMAGRGRSEVITISKLGAIDSYTLRMGH